MSDKDKKLNKGELIDIKSLIGDADGGGFSLDDIMAEYGHPAPPPEDEKRFNTIDLSKLPRPAAKPRSGPTGGRVVAFPGAAPPPAETPDKPRRKAEEPPAPPEPEQPAPVIPFPKEESVLTSFLRDLGQRADDYADRMFEEDEAVDKKEVRRLERLIPGTDREDEAEEDSPSPRPWRFPRLPEPVFPDTPPQELARKYGKGLKWMRARVLLTLLLALLSLCQAAVPALGLVWPSPLDRPQVQYWLCAGLLGTGVLLSADALLTGIARAFRLRLGMDTLAALACGFTLADTVEDRKSVV